MDSCYDSETGSTNTPVSSFSHPGLSYLGAKCGYIIQNNVSEYFFGCVFWEADVSGAPMPRAASQAASPPEADLSMTKLMPPIFSSSASIQPVWGTYWSQTTSLFEEEK